MLTSIVICSVALLLGGAAFIFYLRSRQASSKLRTEYMLAMSEALSTSQDVQNASYSLARKQPERGDVVYVRGESIYMLAQCVDENAVWCVPFSGNTSICLPLPRKYPKEHVFVSMTGVQVKWANS